MPTIRNLVAIHTNHDNVQKPDGHTYELRQQSESLRPYIRATGALRNLMATHTNYGNTEKSDGHTYELLQHSKA